MLLELHACLKPGGVLFSSNPRGHNEEGWNDGRYGTYLDLKSWRRFVSSAGFVELTHYYQQADRAVVKRTQRPERKNASP